MFSVQCSVFSVQCSVFSVQCSVFSVQCSVFSVQCSVFGVRLVPLVPRPDGTTESACHPCRAGLNPPLRNKPVPLGVLVVIPSLLIRVHSCRFVVVFFSGICGSNSPLPICSRVGFVIPISYCSVLWFRIVALYKNLSACDPGNRACKNGIRSSRSSCSRTIICKANNIRNMLCNKTLCLQNVVAPYTPTTNRVRQLLSVACSG